MAKLKRSLSATKSEQGINTTEKLPIVRTFEEPSAPNREELLEEKIEKLNRQLRDSNPFHRREAALEVLNMGPKAKTTIPALIDLYKYEEYYAYSDNWSTWDKCLLVMGNEAVPAVIQVLEEGDVKLKRHMARVLGKMGGKAEAAISVLIKASCFSPGYLTMSFSKYMTI